MLKIEPKPKIPLLGLSGGGIGALGLGYWDFRSPRPTLSENNFFLRVKIKNRFPSDFYKVFGLPKTHETGHGGALYHSVRNFEEPVQKRKSHFWPLQGRRECQSRKDILGKATFFLMSAIETSGVPESLGNCSQSILLFF